MNKFSIAPAQFSKSKNNIFNLFDEVFGKDMEAFIGSDQKNTMPAVNISETDKEFVIDMAVPGYQKSDFNLAVEDRTLTLSTAPKTDEDKVKYNRREFNYGAFNRSFKLPKTANNETINATYKNGILKLSIPKLEEAEKKALNIKIK